jgi:RNA polymerase sigma-70 factor (ECF subfamily)
VEGVKRELQPAQQRSTQIYLWKDMELGSPGGSPSEPVVTDAEILHALKNKHPMALEMLYDRFGGVVYGVALKVLKHHSEAEDLTQEIFLALWHRAAFDPNHDCFVRYLITMTRSRAIDKLRSRGRTLNLLQRWGQTVNAETTSPTPFEQAALTERSQRVREALTHLSDQQRRVIEMAYDQGLSQSEIAQQLDTPLGTVKSWTRQALLKLKPLLQDSID